MNKLAVSHGYYIFVSKVNDDECILDVGKSLSEKTNKIKLSNCNGIVKYSSNDTDTVLREVKGLTFEQIIDIFLQKSCEKVGMSTDLVFLKTVTEDQKEVFTPYFKKD